MAQGYRVKGDGWLYKNFDIQPKHFFIFNKFSLVYHVADKGGRLYFCDCWRHFRVGSRHKCAGDARRKRFESQKGRNK